MSKTINKVIKNLIYSDIFLLTGLGFVAPIFAIFLSEHIKGGNVQVAGFAAAAYLIVHSLIMIPIGKFLDKNHGEKDDLWFIVIGNVLAAISVFGYFFAEYPRHIYFLQGLYGLGMAMNMAGWTAIFTRHIDKGKEAYEWSVRGAWVGMGGGVAGAVGGWVAYHFGFEFLFTGIIVFILISAVLPLFIFKEMKVRNKAEPIFPEIKIMPPTSPKE
jgi:MFS family permease